MESPKNGNGRQYRSVKLSALGNRRRGRHHELTEGIIRELKTLKEESALVVPLVSVGGLEVANLRSAVHRAAALAKIEIQTQSDEENLYVWTGGESAQRKRSETENENKRRS